MNNIIGILFGILWASGGVAIKTGIKSTSPLNLALLRFIIAGLILFSITHVFWKKERLPKGDEWGKLMLFGFFGVTVYVGCFFIAAITTSVGLLNLFVAINPLIITLLAAFWLKRKISNYEIVGLLLCFSGLVVATFPSLQNSTSTIGGLIILTIGMIGYSFSNVYFKKINLPLSNLAINTWQVIFGGLGLLPIVLYLGNTQIIWDKNLFISVLWLSVVISIATMLIWFYLLKKDAVKAGRWLYLSPIAGYFYANFFYGEKITMNAFIGTVFVIVGLYISKKEN